MNSDNSRDGIHIESSATTIQEDVISAGSVTKNKNISHNYYVRFMVPAIVIVLLSLITLVLVTGYDLRTIVERRSISTGIINPTQTSLPTAMPTGRQLIEPGFLYKLEVIDSRTSKPLQGIHALLELAGQAPLDGYSDTYGFVQFTIPSMQTGKSARIIVSTTGYKEHVQAVSLYPDQMSTVISLRVLNE